MHKVWHHIRVPLVLKLGLYIIIYIHPFIDFHKTFKARVIEHKHLLDHLLWLQIPLHSLFKNQIKHFSKSSMIACYHPPPHKLILRGRLVSILAEANLHGN
ncbi:hypothetical protein PRUPE_1G567300 [Prunus persica]|uniref:Uncharacterized protein n=1 Tax=Prunus persica TaxID=3760 RepID=M5XFM5_PRUPE|nr:hypothetical protein PRUPE_1G567300 [Prunus persica]